MDPGQSYWRKEDTTATLVCLKMVRCYSTSQAHVSLFVCKTGKTMRERNEGLIGPAWTNSQSHALKTC